MRTVDDAKAASKMFQDWKTYSDSYNVEVNDPTSGRRMAVSMGRKFAELFEDLGGGHRSDQSLISFSIMMSLEGVSRVRSTASG